MFAGCIAVNMQVGGVVSQFAEQEPLTAKCAKNSQRSRRKHNRN